MNDSIKREQSELAYSAERENLRPKGKKIINPWRNHEGYSTRRVNSATREGHLLPDEQGKGQGNGIPALRGRILGL